MPDMEQAIPVSQAVPSGVEDLPDGLGDLARKARLIAKALQIESEIDGKVVQIPQKPTARQCLFLEDLREQREVFFGGAAGGGKSSTLLMAALQYIHIPHYAALILRRTYKDLALPGAIMDRAKSWLIGKPNVHWDGDTYTFTFTIPISEENPRGGKSTLTFGYLATDVDKYQYQGAELTFVGYDELTQFEEPLYTYLFSRLRRPAIPCAKCTTPMERKADGKWVHKNEGVQCEWYTPTVESEREYAGIYQTPLRMRAAGNPGGVGHEWVKSRFIPEDYTCEGENELRFWEKIGVDDSEKEFHTYFVPSKVQDNPFVDQQSYIESLGRLDRITRRQLLYGDWAISPTGECYFNWDALMRYQPVAPTLGELVEDTDEFGRRVIRFVPKPDGRLAIWRKPQQGRRYVQGNDTASGKDANKGEGKPSRDFSVSQIFDIDSGEQVARLRGRIPERVFGEYWALLARWYNGAYVVPAVTGGYGRAALTVAINCGLPLESIYQPEDETGIPGRRKGEASEVDLGFIEDRTTRPTLYTACDLAMVDGAITLYDAVTINECYAFEYNKDGKPEARSGSKDDCVTSLALVVKGIKVAPAWFRVGHRFGSQATQGNVRKWGSGVSKQESDRQRQEARRQNSIAEFRAMQERQQRS